MLVTGTNRRGRSPYSCPYNMRTHAPIVTNAAYNFMTDSYRRGQTCRDSTACLKNNNRAVLVHSLPLCLQHWRGALYIRRLALHQNGILSKPYLCRVPLFDVPQRSMLPRYNAFSDSLQWTPSTHETPYADRLKSVSAYYGPSQNIEQAVSE